MAKTEHTPGPWYADSYGVRNRGGYICELRHPSRYDGQQERYERERAERDGDARLIAAAPELFAALESAIKCMVEQTQNAATDEEIAMALEMARAAIARAKGEA